MFERMVWGRLKPGAWEGYERYFREKVVPLTSGTKGLTLRRLLRGIDEGEEGVSLTRWETLDDLRNYENNDLRKSLAAEIQENYATSWSYATGEYWVKVFEVIDITRYPSSQP